MVFSNYGNNYLITFALALQRKQKKQKQTKKT